MSSVRPTALRTKIEGIYKVESQRVFATLVRLLRDFDLAEDGLHEAYATAMECWERDGIPDNPRSWLVSTARFKVIDSLRRKQRFKALQPHIAARLSETTESNAARAAEDIEDDSLRLIFTCCHPAIDPKVQVPLTLREVCGLTTEEIARAFLTSPSTISAVHSDAASPEKTDRPQIVALYDVLLRADASPVIELNRAVAVAMRDDPPAGLGIIDAILARGDLVNYHLSHAARADLLRRLGRTSEGPLLRPKKCWAGFCCSKPAI
ncbi:MAG: sigma-70 family RNA polymerase sigma factor [Rhodopirellula sp.]|nr:sigma-70 family RNA polymerase sigma factor [Rhodopirellula sp.]